MKVDESSRMQFEKVILNIITNSGEAKTLAMKAIQQAKEGDFAGARISIDQADKKLVEAHEIQSDLIKMEARGEEIEPTILLIHGQDHLMTARLMKDMALEFLDLYERLEDN